jgi:hypothetical protein
MAWAIASHRFTPLSSAFSLTTVMNGKLSVDKSTLDAERSTTGNSDCAQVHYVCRILPKSSGGTWRSSHRHRDRRR